MTQLGRVPIPAADLAALLLGPGTTISHKAIRTHGDPTRQFVDLEGLHLVLLQPS